MMIHADLANASFIRYRLKLPRSVRQTSGASGDPSASFP